MKKTLSILFLILSAGLSITFSFGQNTNPHGSDQIVLIFRNAPQNCWFIKNDGSKMKTSDYEINYFDDNLISHGFKFQNALGNDTLIIKTKRNFLELSHVYRGKMYCNYLFKRGDTVLFSYDGLKPWAQVINRKVLPYDINYSILVIERIDNDNYPALTKYYMPLLFTKNPGPPKKEELEKEKKQYQEESKIQIIKKNNFLDSMLNSHSISANFYNYNKTNFKYFLRYLSDNAKWTFPDSVLRKNSIEDVALPTCTSENDTILFYGWYFSLVSEEFKRIHDKAKRIETPNSIMIDFREVFDSLCSNKNLYVKAKNYFLLTTMDMLIPNFSASDVEKYIKKFKDEVKDTAILSYFNQKYRIDPQSSNDLQLKDISGKSITFKEILNRYKGKVLYIDFWASWCVPCRQNMPDSKKLHSEFHPKGVEFIYISSDEKSDKWVKASKELNLNENNYIINNQKVAKMLRELEISAIPRYLLYDKKGKLVHKNAPRPMTDEIRKLFTKYISE